MCINMCFVFLRTTCQSPADAPSRGKYLAQAMSPKISLLVGSGKYSFLNILTSFSSGSLYISECFCCSLLWCPISIATGGFSGLSEHLSRLILAPASRWVMWTVVMLHSLCSVLFFSGSFFPQKTSPNSFSGFQVLGVSNKCIFLKALRLFYLINGYCLHQYTLELCWGGGMIGILIKEALTFLEGQERLDKLPCIQGYTGVLGDPECGGIYYIWEAKKGKEYESFDCKDYKILNKEDLGLFVSKKQNQPKGRI